MKSPATDKMPGDPTRKLIYQGDGYCLTANRPIYAYWTIYFTAPDRDTTDTSDVALFKRTIMPQTAACARPWQRNSCHPDDKNNAAYNSVCESRDEKLVSGVTKFWVTYKNEAGVTVTAPSATRISVELSVSKQVAGNAISFTSTSTSNATNIKSIASNPAAPALGTINFSRVSPGPNPYRTTFSWNLVGNAMSYEVRYRFLPSGGAWSAWSAWQPVAVDWNPSYSVDGSARKETPEIEVRVLTSSGTYPLGTRQATALPSWNDCTFQNGWNNYGAFDGSTLFTTAGFTKTSSKLVGLKGLVKGGTMGQPICTLPVGFRPKFAGEKLIFQAATDPNTAGRIDILPGGEVVAVSGSNAWISLDGIIFAADDSNYTWTSPAWQNGWSNYNSLYGGTAHANLRTMIDSEGRRHVQGLGGYSGTSPNVPMTTPGGAPWRTLHYPALSGNGPGIVQPSSSGTINTRTSPTSWQSLQLIYRLNGATGWQNPPFTYYAAGSFQNWDVNNWPTFRCHRGSDDVVVLEGLVYRSGGDGNGYYIGNTMPCGRFNSSKPVGVEDRLLLSLWSSTESAGRIDLIDGNGLLPRTYMPAWASLDGIHFIAD